MIQALDATGNGSQSHHRQRLRGHFKQRPAVSSEAATVARILVVGAADGDAPAVDRILLAHGYTVTWADDCEAAFAQIALHSPDLVVVQMATSTRDGLEACRRLKSNPDTADIPFVFLATTLEAGAPARAFQAGAVDCIRQPIEAEELLARVNAHIESKRMRDDLRQIIAMKSRQMNMMAHDLKNPIAAVRFSADMLQDAGLGAPDPKSELVESIVEACDHALQFINDTLEDSARVSRVENFFLTEVDLTAAIQLDVQRNLRSAVRKGIELRISSRTRTPSFVLTDHRSMSRVFDNLLSNAIKFSPAGRPVDVVIERDPASPSMRVSVRDRGPGLTAEDRKGLFKPYHRLSARPTGGESSTGLGLSIAYELIGKLGGTIGCDSRPHGGASFWFTLPLSPSPSIPNVGTSGRIGRLNGYPVAA